MLASQDVWKQKTKLSEVYMRLCRKNMVSNNDSRLSVWQYVVYCSGSWGTVPAASSACFVKKERIIIII